MPGSVGQCQAVLGSDWGEGKGEKGGTLKDVDVLFTVHEIYRVYEVFELTSGVIK